MICIRCGKVGGVHLDGSQMEQQVGQALGAPGGAHDRHALGQQRPSGGRAPGSGQQVALPAQDDAAGNGRRRTQGTQRLGRPLEQHNTIVNPTLNVVEKIEVARHRQQCRGVS
jgi:hypothetical protein